MTTSEPKPLLVIVGQTPPPWHGQAVATQMLFDAPWSGYEVRTVRMAFSSEMEEVGRVSCRKAAHIFYLWKAIRNATRGRAPGILIYPPASPNWVPLLRDVMLLPFIRGRFKSVVYIYHAGGVGEWFSESKPRRWLARIAYGKADLSLEVAREHPSPHEILGALRWAWTPYGVQVPDLMLKDDTSSERTVVLFVGSLQEGKGVLEVIKTASRIKEMGRERDFLFRIVGRWFSSEFELQTRNLLVELQVETMVEFPGQLTGNDKWQAYAEADVFFFPTHYSSEAFPLVLIEALGCGLPVVTTRWRGIPDLFEGCNVAKLCGIRSPSEYVDALLDFERLAQDGVNFVEDARSFYESRYLPANFLMQVESLVNETVSPGLGDPPSSSIEPSETRTMIPIQVGTSVPRARASGLAGSEIPRKHFNAEESLTCRGNTLLPYDESHSSDIRLTAYLADQNPRHDRSIGISRMTQVVLEALQATGRVEIGTISSKTSQQAPGGIGNARILPWGTRRKWVRMMTDHLHPLFVGGEHDGQEADVLYFPKGYLPYFIGASTPSVVTIHDTIIQYDGDHYPEWRSAWAYRYWARMLKHTLREADRIITVSQSAKRQIEAFMERHGIPAKEITVTYEPCLYESIPQPVGVAKENFVIHLASCEPHKRTAHLIRWWLAAEAQGQQLPTLHLIGSVPPEVIPLLARAKSIVKRLFLEESALQDAYLKASALILPSEIEGFGLPALEAYYLGTPVCYVEGTSVEEILGVATHKGGFNLQDPLSLFNALNEVMSMSADEVQACGLQLRQTYAAQKVAQRMIEVFEEVRGKEKH